MLLVNLNRNSFAIVPHSHRAFLGIDVDLESIHFTISLVVVRSIDKHFVKNFVEGRDILNFLICKLQLVLPQDPFAGLFKLDAANVSVWTDEDVLELSLLLVNLLDFPFPH